MSADNSRSLVQARLSQAEVDAICAKHDRLWSSKPGGARAVFAFKDLSGTHLFGRNLCDADFTGAIMNDCKLKGARLDNATLFCADLTDSDLREASMRRADLRGSCMRNVNLTGADLFEQIFAFDFRSYIEDKGFTGAGNLFVTKAVFEKVGAFSNGVSEDLEWSKRAVAKGFRLRYAHDAVVSHPTRPDWPALRHKWKRMVREEFLTRRQSGRGRASWLARQLLVAASPLVHTGKVLRTDFTPAEKSRAIGALWRLRWWRAVEGVRVALENPTPQAVPRGRDES